MSYNLGIESNKIKQFNVIIQNIKITNAQIISINIGWDLNLLKVTGRLTFMDSTHIVEELPIRGNEIVEMNITDSENTIMKNKFVVVDVTYSKAVTGDTITHLELLDPLSINCIKLYPSTSFLEANMSDIINSEETLQPYLTDKEIEFESQEFLHKNFVVPLNQSFNVTCNWLMKNNNYLFFQNRKSYIITDYKTLFSREPSGEKYIYKPNNKQSRVAIYEYKANFGNMIDALAFQPNGKIMSMDIFEKEAKTTEESYSSALDKIGSTSNISTIHETGYKHYYKSDYTVEKNTEYMYSKNSSNNLTLEILVPGRFSTNIGDILEVDLVNAFTGTESEKNINGKWLVTEIVDIIMIPEFLQRITLTRGKFHK